MVYFLLIATYIDIPFFYIKYLTIHKVQMHVGAIRKLLHSLYVCTEDNPLAKARGLSPRTDAQTMIINKKRVAMVTETQ